MPTIPSDSARTRHLAGKVILITGGTAGLGEALVKSAAQAGAKVVFCGLLDDHGAAIAEAAQAKFIHADVRDWAQCDALVRTVMADHGRLDAAINNAGISHSAARFADLDLDLVRDVMRTNVMGIWHMMKAEIPVLLQQGGGHIVNIASILSEEGAQWMAAYGTSKYAVIGLTKSAALDYRAFGLKINAVSPGPMQTPMFDRAIEDIGGDLSKYAGGLPESGPVDPAVVARRVLDLIALGEAAPTGDNILVCPARH